VPIKGVVVLSSVYSVVRAVRGGGEFVSDESFRRSISASDCEKYCGSHESISPPQLHQSRVMRKESGEGESHTRSRSSSAGKSV
jgi:hypothetical protein